MSINDVDKLPVYAIELQHIRGMLRRAGRRACEVSLGVVVVPSLKEQKNYQSRPHVSNVCEEHFIATSAGAGRHPPLADYASAADRTFRPSSTTTRPWVPVLVLLQIGDITAASVETLRMPHQAGG